MKLSKSPKNQSLNRKFQTFPPKISVFTPIAGMTICGLLATMKNEGRKEVQCCF